jgi:putative transposase
LIEHGQTQLSIRQQCALVGLNRATYYYEPAGESELNLRLMRLLDEQYARTPFYGWPRMTAYLQQQGYAIDPKRVRRLHSHGARVHVPRRRH